MYLRPRPVATVVVISDCLTAVGRTWATKFTMKDWNNVNLSRSDFRKKPELMLYFLKEIKEKNTPMTKEVIECVIKLLEAVALIIKPIPSLEVAPTAEEYEEAQKQILKQEIQEQSRSIESQMEEARQQRVRFNMDVPEFIKDPYEEVRPRNTNDSNMMIPILLLGAAIFVLMN